MNIPNSTSARASALHLSILFLLVIGLSILSSCISTGAVHVTSDPPGAKVYVGSRNRKARMVGSSPCKINDFDVSNYWGEAHAWVVWPDGTRSETQERVGKKKASGLGFGYIAADTSPAVFHFRKSDSLANIEPGSIAKKEKPYIPPLTVRPPIRDSIGPIAQRWAVVIGISDYAHETNRLPSLKYAHRDAEKLAAFLKSKAGGAFPSRNVKLLTNRQATAVNIRSALFEFLKHTVKEDLVVIYFSGHGLPDPDKPSNLYLVAHDSNPGKIASTGFPMWDLDTALKRTIAAQRVIVLADTCHSAGVTEGFKGVRIGDSFNKYFDELAKTKPGRVIFTSCEGYEVSREGKKWGGGHGVFTWALLEGMKGKADSDKNGIVTLGEMLDYVDITVRRETANEQHPTKAGVKFDRNLPMGVVK